MNAPIRLVPFSPRAVPTLWTPAQANVADVLHLAVHAKAERVMLTGAKFGPAWLLGTLPEGWTHGAHHLDHETPVGRYVRQDGRRVEVRRAAEWFGAGDYSPATAAAAWDDLLGLVRETFGQGAGLLGSPGATGRELWLRSLPWEDDGTRVPPQVSAEVAELIRATSGQHRIELLPPPASGDRSVHFNAPGLHVLDGRLMYAACVRELGTAPAGMMTCAEANELLNSDRGRYARARYHVRATVPANWHTVGILPLQADELDEGWSYPREPGRTFDTWADAAEVALARDWGWDVHAHGGIRFTEGRPLDTWAARILRTYDRVDPNKLGTERAKMVRAGLRWMLLHSVGAWHSTGRTETTITAGRMVRPQGEGWGPPEDTSAGGVIWRRRVELDGRAALMAHPEWSAQIWGRARARVLSAPTAERGVMAGALYVEPTSLVSIYGDAVMTTTRPGWAAPEFDDGRPGRLRVKGYLPGPLAWPSSARDRDSLMHKAERHTKEQG